MHSSQVHLEHLAICFCHSTWRMIHKDVSEHGWYPGRAPFAFQRISSAGPISPRTKVLNLELHGGYHSTSQILDWPNSRGSCPSLAHSCRASWHFGQRAFQKVGRNQCLWNRQTPHVYGDPHSISFCSIMQPVAQVFPLLAADPVFAAIGIHRTYAFEYQDIFPQQSGGRFLIVSAFHHSDRAQSRTCLTLELWIYHQGFHRLQHIRRQDANPACLTYLGWLSSASQYLLWAKVGTSRSPPC